MSASLQQRVKQVTPGWQSKLNVSVVRHLLLPLVGVLDIFFISQSISPKVYMLLKSKQGQMEFFITLLIFFKKEMDIVIKFY